VIGKIELTVAGALVTDDGRGIARIDSKAKKMLNLVDGDIIEIKGHKKSTAAVVWSAHQPDEGLDFIRVDGYIRQNIGVGISDRVLVSKADVKTAEKIILAPLPNSRTPISPDFAEYAKNKLEDKPVVKGDVVPVPMFGYVFNFVVVQVSPHGVVRVTKNTDIVVRSEPAPESLLKMDEVHYSDIGGLKHEIERIREIVELPIRNPELNENLGIESKKGILIYGPSGTGKTLLAMALANELAILEVNVILRSGPEFLSKFIGEPEERLRNLFKEASDKMPSVIIIDRIESIISNQLNTSIPSSDIERRLIAQFAILFDEIHHKHKNIVVIGITNNPKAVSPELMVSGRFDVKIELNIPDLSTRKEILFILFRKCPLSKDVSVQETAELTEGYTGADIKALINEAGLVAIRRDRDIITKKDILEASKVIDGNIDKKEKPDDILREFDKTIKLNPNNADAHHKKGEALLEQGRYEEAIEEFDKAIKLDPNFTVAYNNKGAALSGLGSSEEAIEEFDKAIKLDPKYARAYYNKGAVFYYHGKYKESIEMYDIAIKLAPTFAEVYDSKGNALQHLDRYEEAVKEFDKAIKLNSSESRYSDDRNAALRHLKKK